MQVPIRNWAMGQIWVGLGSPAEPPPRKHWYQLIPSTWSRHLVTPLMYYLTVADMQQKCVGALMIQIRISDGLVKPVCTVLPNGVVELSIASTDSLDLAIEANQELLLEAVCSQFTDLFGGNVYPRRFEQTGNGILIRPDYCKFVSVCLESEFPKL